MDSGYNNHMTTNVDAFISLNTLVKTRAKIGDGIIHEAHGKEVVKVKPYGSSYIKDVLYMSNLDSNLLNIFKRRLLTCF